MDFNEAYDDTSTSVGLAARMGNKLLLQELLQKGRPTNGHDNRGWRPLHEAAHGGHAECVRLLLTAEDSELDALTHERTTALLLACRSGSRYYETMKVLLSAGADPNMEDGDQWERPLTRAVSSNDITIVKLLLDAGADPNLPDCQTGTPLLLAAEQNSFDIAKLLVERGADVHWSDESERVALHALFISTHEKRNLIPLLDLLVKHGCDVNACSAEGTTPLMLAVQLNNEEAVTRLLECGADPNKVKEESVMALHFAIEFCPSSEWSDDDESDENEEERKSQILKKILDLTDKSLLHASASSNYSIFHLAIQWNRFGALKLLIERGFSPDSFLQETASAIVDEADVNLFRQVPLVVSLGHTVDTPLAFLLSKPLTKESIQVAKFLIDRGSSVNPVNRKALPPLVAASKHQRATYDADCPGLEILLYLLENGADIYHTIRKTDVLPAALHISSLFNASAFFTILQWGVPVHEIYTRETLERISDIYRKSRYYTIYPLFPWRVISWLHILNMFIPQLPVHTKEIFDLGRAFDDKNLTSAWSNLNAVIESPKSLQSLCVLAVRRAVGNRKGWSALSSALKEIQCDNAPLPHLIMERLHFKHVQKSSLYHNPPLNIMMSYMLQESSDSSDSSSDVEDMMRNRVEDEPATDNEDDAPAGEDGDSAPVNEPESDPSDDEKMDTNEEEMSPKTKRKVSESDS